jgi:asparagine synthase (glutamine-hydrolysing)
MHRRFGKLPWRELFADAIALAEASPISAVLARNIALSRETLAKDPGCAALYLPGDILFKVDRASMYNSLEVRAPFLDHALAEAAFALPSRLKFRGGATKYLLKRLAERHLPAELVHRPKHGFAVPVASLLRGTLRARIAETILDAGNPLASWFRRPALEVMLRDHESGRRDHRKRLWTLYCLFRFAAFARAG